MACGGDRVWPHSHLGFWNHPSKVQMCLHQVVIPMEAGGYRNHLQAALKWSTGRRPQVTWMPWVSPVTKFKGMSCPSRAINAYMF